VADLINRRHPSRRTRAVSDHISETRGSEHPCATGIVRGPAVKDRFLVTDRVTGQAWWQYGAITESRDDAARKRMNTSQANACLQQLIERQILP
jgi:hypothetical protein